MRFVRESVSHAKHAIVARLFWSRSDCAMRNKILVGRFFLCKWFYLLLYCVKAIDFAAGL